MYVKLFSGVNRVIMKKHKIFYIIMMIAITTLAACDQGTPRIGNVMVTGELFAQLDTSIMITCTVLGAEHTEIAEVKADLGMIGGTDNATFVQEDNDNWLWSGEVTPLEEGDIQIVISSKDHLGRQEAYDFTVQVKNIEDYPPDNSGKFVDNNDGTVTDTATGLVWLKNASPCYKSWDEAAAYCKNLQSGTDGLSDGSTAGQWRLPSRYEMLSLFQPQLCASNRVRPGEPFQNIQSDNYWSTTVYADNDSYAWRVNVASLGQISSWNKSSKAYVWPVR